jgi:thiol:disulfide interchange protein DsbD
MKQPFLACLIVLISLQTANSQVIKPVKWSFSTKQIDKEQVDLVFKATISSPWHMYGLNIPEGGPIATSISIENAKGFQITGKPTQSPKPEVVDDPIFNMKLELHSGVVTYTQRIKITGPDSIIVKGALEFMTCSDMQCIMGDQDFSFRLSGIKGSIPQPVKTAGNNITTDTSARADISEDSALSKATVNDTISANKAQSQPSGGEPKKPLWKLFFISLLAGLGALLTPCVYPMIPMTVSYFLRGEKPKSRAITEALVFGFSIVFLYTMIGVLVAIFKNPNAINNFTTYWLTNLVFALIFIVLSASFFGMFEIMLPSGFANKVDRQADRGGYIGAFFMALAMAILSFSCTGPIVASLLIKASQGEVLEPVIGMAGFSIVFALPFTLFAIFPSWLQRLPKSGSWLNSIKVFFAFIMLAFSIYFLSKIDQAYHLNIISRSLYISIWTVIFALLGLYLLGKIKLPHDSDLPFISVPRFVLSIISFSFALFLFTGLLGNELKSLSTILPPIEVTQHNVVQTNEQTSNLKQLCNTPKYSDFLSLPHGLNGYFDYQEALACAKQQNKPVFVDFVGHTCSNCKKMYAEVWSDPRVLKLLNEKFIVLALYTDDKTRLPESEWITSATDGKIKNTIGKKNQDLQITRFNSNALPLYIIVDANGKDLSSSYYTYDPDIEKFIAWLNGI